MNAMGHEIRNTMGVDQRSLEEKIRALIPGYMAMGETGMAEHAAHIDQYDGAEEYASHDDGQRSVWQHRNGRNVYCH